MLRRPLRLIIAASLVVGSLGALAAPAGAAARVPTPSTRGLPVAIESMTPYIEQSSCDPHTWSGTKALARLLATTYRGYGATDYHTVYACGTDGSRSEHYDGRAIDWMTDVHNRGQRTAATAAIAWLTATDRAGNRAAMARRLGVMYIIWNNRIWGSWDGRWDDYNGCTRSKAMKARSSDNACHRTHVHISLSWDGALKRTSYWSHRVPARTDFGPCPVAGQNWAYLYLRPNYAGCGRHSTVKAGKGASATKKALVKYSGAGVRLGWSGPAVSAVQRAFRVADTAHFDTRTRSAVRAFQARHHVKVTGSMTPATWTVLLRVVH